MFGILKVRLVSVSRFTEVIIKYFKRKTVEYFIYITQDPVDMRNDCSWLYLYIPERMLNIKNTLL